MAISLTSHGWTQLGTHSYARRYEPFDITIGVVVGDDAVLVIDSRASVAEGEQLRADVGTLSDKPIRGVVNTHQHFDHTLGNAAFPDIAVIGHESLTETLGAHLDEIRADARSSGADSPADRALISSPTRVPDVTLSSVWSADLGDCLVEVVHPGRAHTAGDVVVKVTPDRVTYVGDLTEQSGPPSYGTDSYPLEWADALDFVVGVCEPESTIVPGHGDAVDRDFLQEQRKTILDVANQIRDAASAGESVDEALQREWPLDPQVLTFAIRRGFEQLGLSAQ
ncbi:MAG TPA: MBL fold metallo-hydrolase [Nocardioidaceae bacterium]|nr:MBL fold metallo-hydrolase [Nocardioidaceae bacterium]